MPDANGVTRTVSSFENDFREFNGRAPTSEETKKHLAFDRLAKSSTLDPATLLLIVDAGADRAEVLVRLERIQQAVETRLEALPAARKKGVLARLGSPSGELLAFALALICFAAIVLFVDGSSARVASIALYCLALALGVAGAATYGWLYGRRR
jgi:hypothetical protein